MLCRYSAQCMRTVQCETWLLCAQSCCRALASALAGCARVPSKHVSIEVMYRAWLHAASISNQRLEQLYWIVLHRYRPSTVLQANAATRCTQLYTTDALIAEAHVQDARYTNQVCLYKRS
eukprot:17017-Heterococcus_DN1.PRE.5